jgi:hypothetical protein
MRSTPISTRSPAHGDPAAADASRRPRLPLSPPRRRQACQQHGLASSPARVGANPLAGAARRRRAGDVRDRRMLAQRLIGDSRSDSARQRRPGGLPAAPRRTRARCGRRRAELRPLPHPPAASAAASAAAASAASARWNRGRVGPSPPRRVDPRRATRIDGPAGRRRPRTASRASAARTGSPIRRQGSRTRPRASVDPAAARHSRSRRCRCRALVGPSTSSSRCGVDGPPPDLDGAAGRRSRPASRVHS